MTIQQMACFEWSARYALGEPMMDEEHRQFVRALDRLLSCPDAELGEALTQFESHARRHFAAEDAVMAGGYPSAQCHLDEHKAVLVSVSEVLALVKAGNVDVGRRLARELARWFPEHTEAMDRGLSAWLFRARTGGARVNFIPER